MRKNICHQFSETSALGVFLSHQSYIYFSGVKSDRVFNLQTTILRNTSINGSFPLKKKIELLEEILDKFQVPEPRLDPVTPKANLQSFCLFSVEEVCKNVRESSENRLVLPVS